MKNVVIVYSPDFKRNQIFSEFKDNFKFIFQLEKKSIIKIFDTSEIKDNPFIPVLFLISIDYYLENVENFNEIVLNKGQHVCNFFITFDPEYHEKISKIELNVSFTLIPKKELHEIFYQTPTAVTPNLEEATHIRTENSSKKLLEIATILGSEYNIEILMNKILNTCMELANADAGSLAILGFDKQFQETAKNILTFYVSKNNSKEIHFNRFSMKIDLNSLAGYSIINKRILNIPDAYKIPKQEQYHFNNSFDKQTGFRTKSILVIPMIDAQGNVMGVIQLLNKKKAGYDKVIDYKNFSPDEIQEFGHNDQQTVLSITNLASVLLKNRLLYNQVNDLLENFVKASVYAVEQRDPTTSGHSARVAAYSVGLAKITSDTKGVLENYHFTPQQLRELRYAALLHDFGKIAIREKTLVKACKLEDYELENILKKISIYLLNFKLEAERKKIALLNNDKLKPNNLVERLRKIDKLVEEEVNKMNFYRQVIVESNIPQVIEESASNILKEIRKIKFFDNNKVEHILTSQEFKFLNIKRGSLSDEERIEIETHVTQSFYFLQQINWISELKGVPEIAYGHHEKLDGGGYPRGLKANEILPQTKIMTVCDIYDALTASDRPYKKALSLEKSIDILYDEVSQNKIDGNLVDIFVKKKIYLIKPELFNQT